MKSRYTKASFYLDDNLCLENCSIINNVINSNIRGATIGNVPVSGSQIDMQVECSGDGVSDEDLLKLIRKSFKRPQVKSVVFAAGKTLDCVGHIFSLMVANNQIKIQLEVYSEGWR